MSIVKYPALLRIALIIAVVGGSILAIFMRLKAANSSQPVDVALDPSVPEYCIPAELQIIEQELSQNPDTKPDPMLLGKIAANEKAIAECIRVSTAYPPAPKPANLAGVLLPTLTPPPLPEIVLGIQKVVNLANDIFLPTEMTEYNYWAGMGDGEIIQVYAGVQRDRDEKWRETHPEWANMGLQGAVLVFDSSYQRRTLIPTPTRNGYVHFVKECDALLILQATDGTFFTFDPVKLAFVSNNDACVAVK